MIELQSNGVPWAFPKPSAIVSEVISLFEVASPRTLPVESKTGPPELPGFIAAVKVKVCEIELTEEIMPVVKIPEDPSGEPRTPTHQPCFGRDPIHCKGGITVFVAMPAKSKSSFQETIVPAMEVPLLKISVTDLVPKQSTTT
jgi:hypothetical protein